MYYREPAIGHRKALEAMAILCNTTDEGFKLPHLDLFLGSAGMKSAGAKRTRTTTTSR